jgi:multidrug transporter EmrE-like cation transporter
LINIALLLMTIVLAAYTQLVYKARALAHAVTAPDRPADYIAAMLWDPWVWSSIVATGIAFFGWIFVLRRLELSVAYPALSGVFVLVALGAHSILGESLSAARLVGLGLIVCGILVVALTA